MQELFLIIFIIAISELIVSGTWQKFYFTMGIPVFKKSVCMTVPPELSPNRLNERFTSPWFDPLRFKKLSHDKIAFREALFYFAFFKINYTPVMHGLIYYDDKSRELHVIGYANWFTPFFILFFIATSMFIPSSEAYIDIIFTIFPIGMLALLYYIQFYRFSKVYKTLAPEKTGKETTPP